MIYFTSDTHFSHKNIINHCNRPFENIHEMNKTITDNWNKTVSNNDTIYHLGDIIFCNNFSILEKLNGNKIFLKGNHDNKKVISFIKDKNWEIYDYLELKYNKELFVLCHYPLFRWNKSHYGSIHLHGHCHQSINKYNENIKRFDVGVDGWNFTPISIDEIIHRSNLIK